MTLQFVLTKIILLKIELMFPLLINTTIIPFMVRFKFVHPYHQYISVKSRITVRQMLKIVKTNT